jgi:hypothetical protein
LVTHPAAEAEVFFVIPAQAGISTQRLRRGSLRHKGKIPIFIGMTGYLARFSHSLQRRVRENAATNNFVIPPFDLLRVNGVMGAQ